MSNMVVGLMETAMREREQTALVREKLARNPRQMTMLLAQQLQVPEEVVVRALPEGTSVELDLARWDKLMAAFAELGEVHVIVSSGAATLESVGVFGGYSSRGGFFNVQSGSLDMHIRQPRIQSAFAVRKPSHFDGHQTLSFQFFDTDGAAAFKVFLTFGGQAHGAEREQQFDAIIQEFGLR